MKVLYSSWNNVVFEDSSLMGVNWAQAKWPQIKLSSAIQFFSCNISYSSFFGLALSSINIQMCKAHQVDFREADLSSANLTNSDFEGCFFMKTILNGADLSDAVNYHIDVLQNPVKKTIFSFPEVVNLLHSFDIVIKGWDNDES